MTKKVSTVSLIPTHVINVGASNAFPTGRGYPLIELQRACKAIHVPAGDAVRLKKGTEVELVQSMGLSFTVRVRGNLFRIAGDDADALGKAIPQLSFPKANDENFEEGKVNEAYIWEVLRHCYDPEIQLNIVDLGLIYSVNIIQRKTGQQVVHIDMTLTAPACGMGPVLVDEVKHQVALVPHVDAVHVNLVFDPPWDRSKLSEAGKLQLGLI
ncbi:putative Fe-S cluster assembly protein SufT [Zooshikella marina]|uniref:putative Fe-S cluster assembly protein SufT n=1 Tax=Zooshikella ganghwensis TaxID=202772 RepID=UPI001BAF5D82|nr:putative Fe-S cluster assembly protein SufT [Zooshikella ganghwensis]MBU2706710.1 putative Fe-S cluster assembly protein SufT [Zooshikella ganghwensis]